LERPARRCLVERTITLEVNGKTHRVTTDPERPLLEVLREDLLLTGPKYGCGEGHCRACTVLVDGSPVCSCFTPVAHAEGRKILTIEGLATGDDLHPVQEAFIEKQAMQCGYCVPGMILTAVAFLESRSRPTVTEIADCLSGNVCRCCNYANILAAVELAAEKRRGVVHETES
jgi:aerobic-type carbon monoxide dehydrogenase small subunit (CoxS/CutS family)